MACDCADRLDRIEALLLRLLGEPPVEPVEPVEHVVEYDRHVEPDPLLEPCALAFRLGLSDGHVRRLCSQGWRIGAAGIEKHGGRWRASIAAIEALRRG